MSEGLPKEKEQKKIKYQKSAITTAWRSVTNILMICFVLCSWGLTTNGKLSMASGHNPESQSFYYTKGICSIVSVLELATQMLAGGRAERWHHSSKQSPFCWAFGKSWYFFPFVSICVCHQSLSSSTLKVLKWSTTSHLKFISSVDNIPQ